MQRRGSREGEGVFGEFNKRRKHWIDKNGIERGNKNCGKTKGRR